MAMKHLEIAIAGRWHKVTANRGTQCPVIRVLDERTDYLEKLAKGMSHHWPVRMVDTTTNGICSIYKDGKRTH
jgi:hypothetical protein